MLKQDAKFQMTEEQLQAIETLKNALTSSPVLKIFEYGLKTELHTDASKDGYGAILCQVDPEDDKLHPVYYMSRKTTDAEKNYSSYELEVLAVIEAVKKFRIYLLGQKFKIVTDCQAFLGTINKIDLTTRVARWALLLQEYDFELEHRPGTRMVHVDALSRNPISMCVTTTSTSTVLQKLSNAQINDERLNAIIQLLKNGPYEDYIMSNGVLCKNDHNKLLFVVPDVMKANIIREAHEKGHFHYKKMKEIIEAEFYIKDLKQRIKRCIAACVKCILAERKLGKPEGFLYPIPKGSRPLETFHIDHLGPLQNSSKNYKYIFAVIDGFTKFSWLFPTKTLNCEEVIKKLEVISETFGYPKRIISDRGGAFISNNFKDYCKQHEVKLHLITPGVPRSNGQIERLFRIVIAVLTKLSLDDPEKWYTHVKPLQRILNSTFQRSIKTTPMELLVGVPMKTDKDVQIMELIEDEDRQQFENERNNLREKARKEIFEIQKENSRQYNRKRKQASEYQVGATVAIERTQFGTGLKIRPKFLGPYKVVAVKGFDRYKVEKLGTSEGPKVTETCADKMKLWCEDDDSYDVEDYDTIELSDEDEVDSFGANE
jgi:transposase InsO family protein